VPYPQNAFFTGRTRILPRLREALTTHPTAPHPQAITGLGGVGKSQTAIEYAYRYRDTYPSGVFWVRAESAATLLADYRAIARELDLREKDAASAETIREAVKRWLTETSDYLLILDNVEDPELAAPFLPPAPKGHVLITSRKRSLDFLNVSAPIDLTVMDSDEAVTFLLCRVSRSNLVPLEGQAAVELAQELGCLPLALEQAGAFIAVHDSRFSDYLAECRTSLLTVLGEQGPVAGGLAEEGSEIRQRATVRTTWERSFRAVREQSPATAELLLACAFFDADYIPEDLLIAASSELGETLETALAQAATSPLAMDRLLRPLVEHSLIRRARDIRTFDIHRLVQEVVRAELGEAELQLWSERVVRALARTYPGPAFTCRALCDLWLPHALAGAQWILSHNPVFAEAAGLLGRAAFHLHNQAQYTSATLLSMGALSILLEALEPGHPDIARALNNLASLYRAQGKLAEAETLAEQALAIIEAAHGPDHPEVGMAGSNLAGIYQERGKMTEAVPLQERALAIMEKQRGPEHTDTTKALNNLGDAYRAQGKLAEAEALFRRALAIRQKILAPDDPDMAISLDNLAMVCQAQGKVAEAESLHQQALMTAERAIAPDHPLLATIMNNVALLYHEQGRYTDARPLFVRSLAIRRQSLGDDHPLIAGSLHNLAGLYLAEGKHTEGLRLLEQAVGVAEKSLGLDHPTTRLIRQQWEEVRAALEERDG
jgi:tetratricopeptide (TPR) repeat protein